MANTSVPIGNEGALTGTTPVTALSAPAASTQRVTAQYGINVMNRDTATRVITIQKNRGGTIFALASQSLLTMTSYSFPGRVVLDATNESLEIVSDGAAATTEPSFDVAALEVT
jgi:hypothetical protein